MTTGEASIPNHYVQGFISNLALGPQQRQTRVVGVVDADLSYSTPGTMFNADDVLGDDDEVEVTTRAPVTPESFATNQRRVGFFKSYAKGRWIKGDLLDVVRELQDPTNVNMAGIMATKARATDDKIIEGLLASAREGATGDTTVVYDTTNQRIAVDSTKFMHQQENMPGSGDLPLTLGKLIYAKVKFDQSEIEGPRSVIVSAHQLGNLLASTPVTSMDYNGVKALVNGETNTLLGFNFVRSERLPIASNNRSCIAVIKPAFQYKERPIVTARISERADRSYRVQAYYEVERGYVRRYDTGVIEILCAEDTFGESL